MLLKITLKSKAVMHERSKYSKRVGYFCIEYRN